MLVLFALFLQFLLFVVSRHRYQEAILAWKPERKRHWHGWEDIGTKKSFWLGNLKGSDIGMGEKIIYKMDKSLV
jgi:hypothetical protein